MTRRTRRIVTTTDLAAGPARPAVGIAWIAAGVLLSAAVLPSSGSAAASEPRSAEVAEELIASVASRYAAARSYRIEFAQESYWALADSLQTTTGTLSVVRPTGVSIRYADGGRIVAVAGTLRVYVPQTNQFFVASLDPSDVLFDPVGVLSAYAPDEEIPFGTPRTSSAGATGRALVRLRPKPPVVEPVRVDVEIDIHSDTIKELTAHSSTGDWTRYSLLETRFDVRPPDSAFRLIPPPDAEIVRGSPYGG